jgi:IstB-like ATP binding protein
MRSSRLPVVKTLADFDFSFQPSLKREQIESLHTLGFLERREKPGQQLPDEESRRALRGAHPANCHSSGRPSAADPPPGGPDGLGFVPPAECGLFNRRFCGIFNRR